MQRLLITAIFFLLTGCLRSQTFQGSVTDTTGKPLEAVSVTLKQGDTPIAFTRTNKRGEFSVATPQGKTAGSLMFSRIGFRTTETEAGQFKQKRTIVLTEQPLQLKEVKVKPRIIVEEGDTLNYLVSGFKQQGDRSIADVIKRMPELSVSSNGTISFRDIPINKFYIEGLDMMGGQYGMASNNIPADKVKSVQVLKNHQPVRLLRKKKFSEKAALNIVLNDSARNVWIATADISGGFSTQGHPDWLRENKLMTMRFSRKLQTLSMYKGSNTGKGILNELSNLAGGGRPHISILHNVKVGGTVGQMERSTFNDTHIAGSNWLFKTKEGTTLRLQVSGITDRTKGESTVETYYTDVDTVAFTSETNRSKAFSNQVNANVQYEINTQRTFLRNMLYAQLNYDHSKGTTWLNGREVEQRVRPHQRSIRDELHLTLPLGKKRTIGVQVNADYCYQPGYLRIVNQQTERLTLSEHELEAKASFTQAIGKMSISNDFMLNTLQKKEEISIADSSAAALYRQHSLAYVPSLWLSFGKLTFNLRATLNWLFRTMDEKYKNHLLLTPYINMKYEILPTLDIEGNFYRYVFTPDFYSISPLKIYTTYNTISVGNGIIRDIVSNQADVKFNFHDTGRLFFANIGTSHSVVELPSLYKAGLSNGEYEMEQTDKKGHSTTQSLNGSVRKQFGWMKASLGLSGTYSWHTTDVLLAGEASKRKTQSARCRFTYYASPTEFLTIDGNSSLNFTRLHGKLPMANLPKSTLHFSHTLRIGGHMQKWNIEGNAECQHSSDHSVSFALFADAKIYYKDDGWEAGLTLNNLLGKQTYEQRFISPTTQVYSICQLRKREIMFQISVDL